MRTPESVRRESLYLIAIMIFAVVIVGTAGAMELDRITLADGIWQMAACLLGGLWFWNLVRIEETRAARRGRMN